MSVTIDQLDVPRPLKSALKREDITTYKQLLEIDWTDAQIRNLAKRARVETTQVRTLISLADLVRVRGIGPTFAARLVQAGVHSAQELASVGPEQLLEILKIIEAASGGTGSLGRLLSLDKLRELCLNAAQLPGIPTTGQKTEDEEDEDAEAESEKRPKELPASPIPLGEPIVVHGEVHQLAGDVTIGQLTGVEEDEDEDQAKEKKGSKKSSSVRVSLIRRKAAKRTVAAKKIVVKRPARR